jgi:hypothetical protein
LVSFIITFLGGVSPNPNPQPLPDWVDATVADWIKTESKAMEEAWGSQEFRAAIAFVHIPPSVNHLINNSFTDVSSFPPLLTARHAIQVLQSNLNSTKNPGLNGMLIQPSKL